MFFRILKQALFRRRGRKLLALLAVAAGMAVATAMLTIRINAGDDLSRELHRYGANLVVVPAADTLPVSIQGVDLRPARAGAYLDERNLPKLKTLFWEHNILAFAPVLFTQARSGGSEIAVEGTWFRHPVKLPEHARPFYTGMQALAPAWRLDGDWPHDHAAEALAGDTLAQRMHWQAGETVALEGEAGADLRIRLTGILHGGENQANVLLLNLGYAQQLAGTANKIREVQVSALTKPEDAFGRQNPDRMDPKQRERWMCSPYAHSIAYQIEQAWPGAKVRIVRRVEASEGRVMNKLGLLMLLITLAALAAGALAVGGVMTTAVAESRGEIALMKALGASDGAIGRLYFFEAALLGLGGGALGFVLGEGMASAVSAHVLGYAAQWKPALAPFMLLLAIAVSLAGCAHALRQAVKLEPAFALRDEAQHP